MDNNKNVYGLTRNIPSEVERQIRQRCGFGCVLCGSAIYQYEHFNPDYSEAKIHDPDGITLLCGACHDKVTRKYWSKEKVANGNINPICKEKGFTSEWFDTSGEHPEIKIGGTILYSCVEVLTINNVHILKIETPEQKNAPYRISGNFFDKQGNLLFKIEQNNFIGNVDAWDIETAGGEIIVRTESRKIALHIAVKPPNAFIIKQLNLYYQGVEVYVKENGFIRIITSDGKVHHLQPSSVTFSPDVKMFAIKVAGNDVEAFGIVGQSGQFGLGDLKLVNVQFNVSKENIINPIPIELSESLSLPYQLYNIRHVWSILCLKSKIDDKSGSISLDTIIEAVNGDIPSEFKGLNVVLSLPIEIEIVTQWARYNPEIDCEAVGRVSIQGNDYCKYLLNYNINLVQNNTFSQRMPIKGLDVKGSGVYQFITEMRLINSNIWHVVSVSSVMVKLT